MMLSRTCFSRQQILNQCQKMSAVNKRQKLSSGRKDVPRPKTKGPTKQARLEPDSDDDDKSQSSESSSESSQESSPGSQTAENNVNEEGEEETPKSFKELGIIESLCEACENLGWKTPTPIQRLALPQALENKDIIGLAETGSGKTGAFALPILQALLEKPQPFFGLVLSPTRELAAQIAQAFEALGSLISLRCALIVGGLDMVPQALALGRKPHIIVATPGRLLDHLEKTKGFSLRNLRYLVMDEADRMLDMDFAAIIDKILKFIPRERRTYLFSATMSSKVESLQRASLRDPVKVSVSSKIQTVKTLQSFYIFIPHVRKDLYLVYLINEFAGQSVIVFSRTVWETQRLSILLRGLGFGAIPLHGQLSQSARLGALNKFKSGARSILIATDVAARGLDIPKVDIVLNYDIPGDSKTYVHRVGRTARAGKSGKAINMVTQYDHEIYQRIEHALGGPKLPEYPTVKEEVMVFQPRVEEAQRQARTEIKALIDDRGKKGAVLKGKRGKEFSNKRRRDDMDAEEG